MIGGLAVRNNLLCVTWSAGRGHVFLYDLDARERMSSWTTPVGRSGYSDVGGVAIDASFRLFIADPQNGCLRRYNAFGQHLGDVGLPPPGFGDRGRDQLGVLDRPHAVACVRERVWVCVGERPRRRAVQCFDLAGNARRALPSRGEPGEKWAAPRGVWCDDQGLVVSDTLRGRLQLFRNDGAFVQEVAVPAGGGDGSRPAAVARIGGGRLLVVEHSGVEAKLVAMRADGTSASLGGLQEACSDPAALAVDEAGRVYVLDHAGERVVRCGPDLGSPEVLLQLSEHDDDAPGSAT
jgi:sugar lactone lactonase YvrE